MKKHSVLTIFNFHCFFLIIEFNVQFGKLGIGILGHGGPRVASHRSQTTHGGHPKTKKITNPLRKNFLPVPSKQCEHLLPRF